MTELPPTSRTVVKRLPERATYQRSMIDAILDEALYCHVGFVHEGSPVIIPTIHARVGDVVYLHGSPAGRMLRTITAGGPISVAVTILDGLVLARSVFHSSMHYRSVILFGNARRVDDAGEKTIAFRAITEHVARGRWADARPPNERELRATMVAAVPIEEASAKVNTGPPKDEPEDYELPIWAGVIPLRLVADPPIADPALRPGPALPPYAAHYRRPTPGSG